MRILFSVFSINIKIAKLDDTGMAVPPLLGMNFICRYVLVQLKPRNMIIDAHRVKKHQVPPPLNFQPVCIYEYNEQLIVSLVAIAYVPLHTVDCYRKLRQLVNVISLSPFQSDNITQLPQ